MKTKSNISKTSIITSRLTEKSTKSLLTPSWESHPLKSARGRIKYKQLCITINFHKKSYIIKKIAKQVSLSHTETLIIQDSLPQMCYAVV